GGGVLFVDHARVHIASGEGEDVGRRAGGDRGHRGRGVGRDENGSLQGLADQRRLTMRDAGVIGHGTSLSWAGWMDRPAGGIYNKTVFALHLGDRPIANVGTSSARKPVGAF